MLYVNDFLSAPGTQLASIGWGRLAQERSTAQYSLNERVSVANILQHGVSLIMDGFSGRSTDGSNYSVQTRQRIPVGEQPPVTGWQAGFLPLYYPRRRIAAPASVRYDEKGVTVLGGAPLQYPSFWLQP